MSISPSSLKQNFLFPTKEYSYLQERQLFVSLEEQREHNSSEHWFDITSDNSKVNETNLDCISSRLKFLLVAEYDSSNSNIYCKVMLPI